MLTTVEGYSRTFRCIAALLFFFSCIAFQHIVSAEDIKGQTAEEYRALGYAAQQKGNLNEALSFYTKVITLGLKSAVLLNDMGVLYEEIRITSFPCLAKPSAAFSPEKLFVSIATVSIKDRFCVI